MAEDYFVEAWGDRADGVRQLFRILAIRQPKGKAVEFYYDGKRVKRLSAREYEIRLPTETVIAIDESPILKG